MQDIIQQLSGSTTRLLKLNEELRRGFEERRRETEANKVLLRVMHSLFQDCLNLPTTQQ